MKKAIQKKKNPEPRFSFFLALSLGIHFVLMFFAGIGFGRSSQSQLTMTPIFVQLYQPQEFPGRAGTRAGPAPENAQAQTPAIVKSAEPPAPAKPKSEAVTLPKDSTKEELKKESSSNLSDAITEEEKKKLAEALSAIKRDVAREEAAGVEAQWRNIIGEINADLARRAYCERVSAVYRNNFELPPSVPQDPGVIVRVIIRIDPTGKIMDYQVLNWSGNQELNRAVKRTLESTTQVPAPALGSGVSWTTCGIGFQALVEEKQ